MGQRRVSKALHVICTNVSGHVFGTRMSNSKKIIVLITGLIITSCAARQESKNGENYSTIVYYNDDIEYYDPERAQERTERALSRDSLYIFFETDFDTDTVDIKINNGRPKTFHITNDYFSGLSTMINYGDIEEINQVEIRKNNGRPLTIRLTDKTMNIWTVRYYSDTLQAQRRIYMPTYE